MDLKKIKDPELEKQLERSGRTREEAETKGKEIMEQIMKEYEEA